MCQIMLSQDKAEINKLEKLETWNLNSFSKDTQDTWHSQKKV